MRGQTIYGDESPQENIYDALFLSEVGTPSTDDAPFPEKDMWMRKDGFLL
jgi:hypothetical protein